MVDFHTHILPNIDDGSRSVQQSVDMLRDLWQQMVTAAVATPHFDLNRSSVQRFLERRRRSYDSLMDEITRYTDEVFPTVVCGAEVNLYPELYQLEQLEDLCITGTRYMLIEMPFVDWTKHIYQNLYTLMNQGIHPIVAHVERYLRFQRSASNIRQLTDMGVVIQMNTEWFEQFSTRRKALKLIENHMVDVLGTDCHNTTNRPPRMRQAVDYIQKKLGMQSIERMEAISNRILPQNMENTLL